jgi:hypothetical protein
MNGWCCFTRPRHQKFTLEAGTNRPLIKINEERIGGFAAQNNATACL